MATSSIGSNIDVNSLVSQLVAAERAPTAKRLSGLQARTQLRLSALGTLKSALAELQTAVRALKSDGVISKPVATSSRPELFTASATSSAVPGSYALEVVSLAQSHKLVSGAYASAETSLGAGTVQIQVGSDSFTVTLGADDNSLAALRSAINDAPDNTGVNATIVNEAGGARLLLTAKDTGLANQLSVTSSLASFTELQPALDAHVRIEGFDRYSASNNLTGVVDGLTINLLKAEPGTTLQLNVATDTAAVTTAIETFVAKYNAATTAITTNTRYDASSKQAGALNGDGTVRSASQALRGVFGSEVEGAGAYGYLSQIGITTQSDGTLVIDSAKLKEALASDYGSVAKLFSGSDGYAVRLDTALENIIGDDGRFEASTETLQKRLKDIDKQEDALDLRMEALTTRYMKQFLALDSLMTRLGTIGNYLSQQLSSLSDL